nr:MAG: RNA dependent RNA polymerase [Leviviridae sp.]
MSLSTSARFILKVLEDLNTPISLSLAIRLRHGDMEGILTYSADPRHYITPERYFRDTQAIALFKKRRDLKLGSIDLHSVTLKKWWDAERECYKSNERLSRFFFPNTLGEQDLAIYSIVEKIRKKIVSWIGPKPPNLDNIQGRFGPGATYSDRGRLTTVPDKMSSTPTLTAGAFWYLLPYLQTKWGRVNQERQRGVDQVRGNRFQVVPKTALTGRPIAIEPAINIFFQLGLGTSIRRRLQKATGWDLDHASDIHRNLVRENSITGKLATIDLSSASDTVCYELVRLVMPPDWFRELNALRSPFTKVGANWVKLEKFSSMGNGYTFELETLIFSAILSVLLEEEGASGQLGVGLFVFGDDIILPTVHARSAIAALRYFGFKVNTEKTFLDDTLFRESCGADFFIGVDVRPVYLKDAVYEPVELIPWINSVRRLYQKLEGFGQTFGYTGWHHLLDCLPSNLKACRGPDTLGDVVIHDHVDRWRYKWKHGIRYFRAVIPVPKRLSWGNWCSEVVLASALYGVGDGKPHPFSGGSVGVIPRDPPLSYRVKWVPSS